MYEFGWAMVPPMIRAVGRPIPLAGEGFGMEPGAPLDETDGMTARNAPVVYVSVSFSLFCQIVVTRIREIYLNTIYIVADRSRAQCVIVASLRDTVQYRVLQAKTWQT